MKQASSIPAGSIFLQKGVYSKKTKAMLTTACLALLFFIMGVMTHYGSGASTCLSGNQLLIGSMPVSFLFVFALSVNLQPALRRTGLFFIQASLLLYLFALATRDAGSLPQMQVLLHWLHLNEAYTDYFLAGIGILSFFAMAAVFLHRFWFHLYCGVQIALLGITFVYNALCAWHTFYPTQCFFVAAHILFFISLMLMNALPQPKKAAIGGPGGIQPPPSKSPVGGPGGVQPPRSTPQQ